MFNAFRLLMMHVEDTVPDLTFSLVGIEIGEETCEHCGGEPVGTITLYCSITYVTQHRFGE
jgi:hypothetical protein